MKSSQEQIDLVLTKVIVKRYFNTYTDTLLTLLKDSILRDPSDKWSAYGVTGFTHLQILKMHTQKTNQEILINKISQSTTNQLSKLDKSLSHRPGNRTIWHQKQPTGGFKYTR